MAEIPKIEAREAGLSNPHDRPFAWFRAGVFAFLAGAAIMMLGAAFGSEIGLLVGSVLFAAGGTAIGLSVLKGRDIDRATSEVQ